MLVSPCGCIQVFQVIIDSHKLLQTGCNHYRWIHVITKKIQSLKMDLPLQLVLSLYIRINIITDGFESLHKDFSHYR